MKRVKTDGEPSSKRPKTTRGDDDYMPGNITKIELSNFMTYEYLCCQPGPRLNLVIGPNGSGKSSIVCAIALGLGGDTQILGRAKTVGAFVKRGQESCCVKIYLRGSTEEESLVITRKMDTRNKSEWQLNGNNVPKKEIIEVTERFNIQVNNLTQFLPQDRVCEFAKMTPVQLLEETEKAVGDPQLPIQHQSLIEKSCELKIFETAIERNGETLNQLKANNAEIEKDVKRARQREELLAKVELMKKKLPWLKYDMKKAEYMTCKEREKEAKEKTEEAARTLKNFMAPIDKQKKKKNSVDLDSRKYLNILEENAKQRVNVIDRENVLGIELKEKYHEIEEIKKQEQIRQQNILKFKEELAAAKQELEKLPIVNPPRELLEKLGNQITELEVSARQKRSQKHEKDNAISRMTGDLRQLTERLKDMENINNKKLLALKRQGAEKIMEAYQWLQQHRHELNKDVFGPVLIEVNVHDRNHAAYLEGHLPHYAWKSFITQDPSDRDYLVKHLKSFDVPILNYVGNDSSLFDSFHISAEMKKLGICSRLDNVFDAPHAVKEVLVGQFGLSKSYIGTMETDKRADVVAKLGINDFWTPENHYRWSKSRYGGHISAMVEPVRPSRLIQTGWDVGEIENLKRKKDELEKAINALEESKKLLQIELRTLENEEAHLQKQREETIGNVQQEKKKRREIETRVDLKKKRVETLEKGHDVNTATSKLMDEAKYINLERFECAISIKKLLVEALSCKWIYAEKQLASIEISAKIGELEANLKSYQKSADQASVQLERCKKETEEFKSELLAAKKHAESVTLITPELEALFLEMPTTIEDLEAAMQDSIMQANSILCLNQNVLEEYEHRQRKIEDIAKTVDANTEDLKNCLADIDSLKARWLPTLRTLVSQINHSFSRNFQEMAVAGEVLLEEHEKDFAQYGILIKVKFRQAEQLQVLSAHHQSGGERSVATILYLVSLQDLTNCPFRVVDEINQGMDPINERKMFQQLVRSASQPNTPQCFLLTPKLLPNLKYSEACSILNIMNGPWIDDASKVWSSGDHWGAVSSAVH